MESKGFPMRPYELPQKLYALWYDIGECLGPKTQSLVSNALCDGTHKIRLANLTIEGEEKILEKMAARRGVMLFFH